MIRDSIDFIGQQGTQARPYARSLADFDLRESMDSSLCSPAHDAPLPSHSLLEPGTLVCFASQHGELCTLVRSHDGTWALHLLATSTPDDYCSRPSTVPPSSIFLVLRNGSKMGFRSLWAEGRTLQAVRAPQAPPRVNNHNFGSWESWSLVNGHLVNCKWTHKALPLAVLPLEACCLDDVRREERIRLQYERQLHTRVDELEHEASGLCEQLREAHATIKQLQANLAAVERQVAEVTQARDEARRHQAAAEAATGEAEARAAALDVRVATLERARAVRDDATMWGVHAQHACRPQDMTAALQHERTQYEQHIQQLEAHHTSLQASHQKHTALLTARLDRSTLEAADSAARLREAHDAALDREAALKAASEQVDTLRRALQAAQDECNALRLKQHPAMPSLTHALPMQQQPRMPLAARMPPQAAAVSHTLSATPPKARAAASPLPRPGSRAEDADTPLMQSAGLSPLSPALFALLEGGESPRGDLRTPRVLPQQDYLRLSSAPDSAPCSRGGAGEASPGGASATQTPPAKRLPCTGHNGEGGRVGGGYRGPLRASVHGYPVGGGAERHLDERVRHWVVADDPSERTTVADPLVGDGVVVDGVVWLCIDTCATGGGGGSWQGVAAGEEQLYCEAAATAG